MQRTKRLLAILLVLAMLLSQVQVVFAADPDAPAAEPSSLQNIDFTDPASIDKITIEEQTSAQIIEGEGLYLVSTRDAFEPCNGQISTFAPKDVVKIDASGDWTATIKFKFNTGRSNGAYDFFGFYAMDDYDNCVGIRAGDGAIQDFIRKDGKVTADTNGVKTNVGLKSFNNKELFFRIVKSDDDYTCYWSTDGGYDYELLFGGPYVDTGIEGGTICIDAYSGQAVGYNYTIEYLSAEEAKPNCEHKYDAVVTEPTCTEGGYTTYTCGLCGKPYVGNQVAASHKKGANDKGTVTEPTCTAAGYVTFTCAACGEDFTEPGAPATGHSPENGVVTEATCTEDGYITYTCGVCSEPIVEDGDPATGHAWDEGIVTSAPGANFFGVRTYTCEACGAKKTVSILPTGSELKDGPNVFKDPESVTGYTVKFLYKNEEATEVTFAGDIGLKNDADRSDTKQYTPFEYKPGLMRSGSFTAPMIECEDGYWYYEVPLAAGANQYWFYVDGNTNYMVPDPANAPIWSPNSPANKNAYNAVYIPYDEKQAYEPMKAREAENPRDGENGTWSYVPVEIDGFTHYAGVYLPYGYDAEREEPYKTIYILHGGGQDESDWMGIGSVQHILDNLIAEGRTEPAVLISPTTNNNMMGGTGDAYANLFEELIPFVEANYNVSTDKMDRSLAGLSMGSMNTQNIINANTAAEKFGYYGPWSGGMSVRANAAGIEYAHILFAGGYADFGWSANNSVQSLKNQGVFAEAMTVTGAHDFNTWCQMFRIYCEDYLWQPAAFGDTYGVKEGPTVVEDPESPTGYTVKFLYKNEEAESVTFAGDIGLINWADRTDTTKYTPFEYKPGLMRSGSFTAPMEYLGEGYWYYEVPLAAGANQYWFYVDGNTRYMVPDPANHPEWSPNSNWETKNAYNAVYVPYDEKQAYDPLAARVAELPRETEKGSWEYVPIEIDGKTHYMGVYLPYGYDPDRAEPYKTIWTLHGGGQDESDWMGIGSVQNIMDNLAAEGRTEPAIIITPTTNNGMLGNTADGYANLFNVVIPFVEANYNVSTDPMDRALCGLSMGSMNTQNIMNVDASAFGYYGPWSGGNGANAQLNAEGVNVFYGNGGSENDMTNNLKNKFVNSSMDYKYTQVAGAHDFNTWCQLFRIFLEEYLWNDAAFEAYAPKVVKDPNSPTGYTGQFYYVDAEAEQVYFCGDLMLSNYKHLTDTTVYSPFDYQPGFMRRGGSQFKEPMEEIEDGVWYYEVPLAAGANQYWFNVDDDGRMLPDPANHPQWSPNSNWDTKNAYNAIYVPYDEKQDNELLKAREIENPRAGQKNGTWSYKPIEIDGATHYMGVYLPYGYDAEREEPYKTIYMLHGGGQDESDWMGIGSVQNILDNLVADGEIEPAVLISLTHNNNCMGNRNTGDFSNTFDIIIPFVEENYNVSTKAIDRSLAGLSAGGSTIANMLKADGTHFGYYGLFSGGSTATVAQSEDLDQVHLFFGRGEYESQIDLSPLDKAGANYDYVRVAGAHDFNTWCQLFTIYVRDYLWQSYKFLDEGPTVMADPESPTGYVGKFLYRNEEATEVTFAGDIALRNDVDRTDPNKYTPFEYQPGFMRSGAFTAPMEEVEDGLWYYEVPLAAGANQYWFYIDGNTRYMVPDPANHPEWSPNSNWATKNAYNAVYVPYAEVQGYAPMAARVAENPRTDGQSGTWSYVPIEFGGRTHYMGIYLPYNYDAEREEPYKLIFTLHGSGQDESDWMGIGSVQHIMDNLVAEGRTEPAIIVSPTSNNNMIGSSRDGFANLFNEILPFLEANYNISSEAEDRAFVGLSMGAMNTMGIINAAADKFGYYAPLSGGMSVQATATGLDKTHIFFATGWDDTTIRPDSTAHLPLQRAGFFVDYLEVTAGHDFNAWCQLFRIFCEEYAWQPEAFNDIVTEDGLRPGPNVIEDENSPTGYTVKFLYENPDATTVTFAGDIALVDYANVEDTGTAVISQTYTPFEYKPGMMRAGSFTAEMTKRDDGYWYYEVPLAAGANQYWFYIDGNTRYMAPDPNNHPYWSPNSNQNTKNAYNAVYVPYHEKQDYEPMAARAAENPRDDDQKGTWSYVAIDINGSTKYMGVYLPYGYNRFGSTTYKTIYAIHGGGQDESDWMGIGSVPNIMDNLIAEGKTEPAIVITLGSSYLGGNSFSNLFDIIIPQIERSYKVSKDPMDRAFCGLSAGGGQTRTMINNFGDQFGYYGPWSSSNTNDGYGAATNLDNAHIMFGVGVQDPNAPRHVTEATIKQLTDKDAYVTNVRVAGGHDFNAWCQLFRIFVDDYAWQPAAFGDLINEEGLRPGPNVIKDPESPTGYTVKFLYKNDEAESVTFAGDIGLINWADPTDTTKYTPFEYKPGLMRSGSFTDEMTKRDDGYWYYEVPLAAGANQYWFYIDGNTNRMVPDPHNHPEWSPNSNWNTKNAYNAVYVPYDEKQDFEPLAAREAELPRDTEKGTWSYVPFTIGEATHYMGVYLPYGYNANRAEPYKTIYTLHGGGQDESDWMGIGSVQNIMDNLAAEGRTEPAIIVTPNTNSLGGSVWGGGGSNSFANLYDIIIPFVEENYNVSTDPMDRALCGLSMGSMYTQSIMNADASVFGFYGPWSGGNSANADLNTEGVNIFFGNGGSENDMTASLENKYATSSIDYKYTQVAGAHDFNTWCQLYRIFLEDYLWDDEAFESMGPKVIKDPESPTGYTVEFRYRNDEATSVTFAGDIGLINWADPTDTTKYTPFEYKPGLMRSGSFTAEMTKTEAGYWYYEVPLAAGANQYWFYIDGKTNRMVPDPANHPEWSPNSNWDTKNAYNAVYVPYDAKQDFEPMAARVAELPRTSQKGTWSYVPFTIGEATHYMGVYLPYGYDANRAEPYKTIYTLHGGGQDESDWMGIGSVQNIMDNLAAEGRTEPAIIVTPNTNSLGGSVWGGGGSFTNLYDIIIPFVEENYNVSTDPMDRALCGLSMGSMFTQNIMNADASVFGYYGPWSGGNGANADLNTEGVNIFFGNGGSENDMTASLKNKYATSSIDYKYTQVAGAHDFNTWCQLYRIFLEDYLWDDEAFESMGPKVVKDPESPTGYTVEFRYRNDEATSVTFAGDIGLINWADRTDTTKYTPFEYKPGLMRSGSFTAEMTKTEAGYWYYEVPLAAGANQYWFYIDGNTRRMVPDPANHPQWSPNSNWDTKNAYNAVYVPYDAKQDFEPMAARVAELPRANQKGTWSYVPVVIGETTHYMGVYLPYGYDANRAEPYKTIYTLHGGGQDESDWMGIGSVQNIMDNLAAEGRTEPAIIVTPTTNNNMLGSTRDGYANLFEVVIPFVEANYNVSTDPMDRALCGLSMGSMNTQNIMNVDASQFGYYGPWSGGNGANADLNTEGVNIFFGNGGSENDMTASLKNKYATSSIDYKYTQVAGAHDFNTWCQLYRIFLEDYLWNDEAFESMGPKVVKDPESPTGYTVEFRYRNDEATEVTFAGDIGLRNYADPADQTQYTPFDYVPDTDVDGDGVIDISMMRSGAFTAPMEKTEAGYWYYEVPLAAGANQYWFYVDGNNNYMVPDPANHPQWSPNSNWDTKNAYNAVYVPYDEKQGNELMAARVAELPRANQKGTWSYVPFQIGEATHYIGVYLPYGYDADREEPYKTIYMQHGGGQDESDWMGIGSVQNIMDNLAAEGRAEPAVIISPNSNSLGGSAWGGSYENLYEIIIPFVEANYNVSSEPIDRAFAGLSMGSMITMGIINNDASNFGYYGPWSGGFSVRETAPGLDEAHIMVAGGRYDFGNPNAAQVEALKAKGYYVDYVEVAGAHDFNSWCQLFRMFIEDYLWQPAAFGDPLTADGLRPGPNVIKDPESPTGYTVKFLYKNDEAETVTFAGDIALKNWADTSDTTVYTPFEYKPGLMRSGSFTDEMTKREDGYWYYEVPLAAGANQYWFYIDGNTRRMVPDPANHPQWSPNSNWNTKNAYNAVYVPYDAKQDFEPMAARAAELPRETEKGTWSYVPVVIGERTHYMGVYLPYGYDANREEPYKTIYTLHGGGQDESDWMGIGSVQNIMDNLAAEGRTEPAIIITPTTNNGMIGNARDGYANLFNEIIPFVEANYNVSVEAEDRAFCGLSMGCTYSQQIANIAADQFGYFGPWSNAIVLDRNAENLDDTHFFFGRGYDDVGGAGKMGEDLAANFSDLFYVYTEVAGAHDFNAWCQLFRMFLEDYLWNPEAFGDTFEAAVDAAKAAQKAAEAAQAAAEEALAKAEAAQAAAEEAAAAAAEDKAAAEAAQAAAEAAQAAAEEALAQAEAAKAAAEAANAEAAAEAQKAAEEAAKSAASAAESAAAQAAAQAAQAAAEAAQKAAEEASASAAEDKAAAEAAKAAAEAAQKAAEEAKAAAEAADANAAAEAAAAAASAAEAAKAQAAAQVAQAKAEEAQKAAKEASASAAEDKTAAEAAKAAAEAAQAAAEAAKAAAEAADASAAAEAAKSAASAAEAAKAQAAAQAAQAKAEDAQKAAEEAQAKADEAASRGEAAAEEAEAAQKAADEAKAAAEDAKAAAALSADAASKSNAAAAEAAAKAAEDAAQVAADKKEIAAIKAEVAAERLKAEEAAEAAKKAEEAAKAAELNAKKYLAQIELAVALASLDISGYKPEQIADLGVNVDNALAAIEAAESVEAVDKALADILAILGAEPVDNCPSKDFIDVPEQGNWAHEGIDYVVANGLMEGIGDNKFAPEGTVTRAQLVTILYREAGEPEVEFKGVFTDVADGTWYSKAVEWAAAEGIVNGVGDNKFAPEAVITREQIATILYRYAGEPEVEGDLSAYPDGAEVSDFAVKAMIWATSKGIITGASQDGVAYLAPEADATRAQIAAIVMRYIEG